MKLFKEADLTSAVTHPCLWCGQCAKPVSFAHNGYQEPEVYSIYRCEHCNTSFSLPRAGVSNIYELIYQNGERTPGYSKYFYYANRVLKEKEPIKFLIDQEPTYWAIFQSLQTLNISMDASIIEVGSGFGYLTYSLRKAGYNRLQGMDISADAVAKAKKRYGEFYFCADLYQYAPANKGRYDVVILTEVIEHIDNADSFLSQLLELLVPGGYVLLTTPNRSFHPAESVWETENPPVHCWWFSEDSFSYFAKKNHLSVDFLDFSPFYKGRVPDYIKVGRKHNSSHVFNHEGVLLRPQRKKTTKIPGVQCLSRGMKRILFVLSQWVGVKYHSIAAEKSWTLCAHIRKPFGTKAAL